MFWPRTICDLSVETFCHRLHGRCIGNIRRRAKFIIFELNPNPPLHMLVHLRMTGRFTLLAADAPRADHEHVALVLDSGCRLCFQDSRKFGRWILTDAPDAILGRLGPEPLSRALSPAEFAARLHRHRRMLKPLLLDQRFLAGLGNIYVDEALWAASLHPCQRSDLLTDDEAQRLFDSIRSVLRRGIRCMGTTLGTGATNFYSVAGRRGRNQDSLRVFRRTGQPCRRCTLPISRIIVGQRSTHICSACQPEPGI